MKYEPRLRHVLFLTLMAFQVSSSAIELYVAPNGSDSTGDGTKSKPWQTPQKAVDKAIAGDTILLRQGVYRPKAGDVSLIGFPGAGQGGQAGARITLKAYPGEAVELKGTLDYGDPSLWDCSATCFITQLSKAPRIVVQGDVDKTLAPKTSMPQDEGTYYVKAVFDDQVPPQLKYYELYVVPYGGGNPGERQTEVGLTDQVIRFAAEGQYIDIGASDGNLWITGSQYGIRSVENSGNHTIQNLDLRHLSQDGIKFNTEGNQNDKVLNCSFSSYTDYGIDSFGSNNQVFKNNYFTEIHPWSSGGAIKLIGGSSNILIEGNVAEDLGGQNRGLAAFEIREAWNVDIINNIISNTVASAILVYSNPTGLSPAPVCDRESCVSRNISIVNNSIYKTGGSAIWFTDNSQDISLYNNIVDNSTATGSNSRALRVDPNGSEGFRSDYNDFYRPGSTNVVRWLGTNDILSGYQAASGLDGHSISLDPQFTNPNAGDFLPQATSPVIDAGSDAVAPVADIAGVPRPQSFAADMGAHEVIAVPIVLAPNASGIVVEKGQQLDIAWRGFTGSSVIIYLYKGSDYLRRVVELTPNDGHFSWTVPSALEIGDDYRIKILSAVDSSKFDLSDNAFAITGSVPEVTFPSAPGVVLARGQKVDITWTGFTGSTVRIFLYRGAQYDRRIANPAPNTGSYSWTVPSSLKPRPEPDYRIEIRSNTDSSEDDFSDNPFNVQ